MKFRRILTLMVAVLLTAGLLSGCGAMNSSYDAGYAPDAGGSLSKPEENVQSTVPKNQKLIRTVWLDAETEDLDTLLSGIEARVAELGGYVEAREVYNGSAYSSRRYRYADLTVRIPAERLDVFVDQVSQTSNITSTNETTENVTLSYVATQSRITALEAEEERLLELMAMAENLEDLLLIEQRLTEVRTELEEVTSQLRLYDNLVDYGTIHLSLQEVKEYTVTEQPETVWERISTGFMRSMKNLGNGLTELFIFLIVCLPYLIPPAVIVVVVVLAVKLSKRRKKKNTPPSQGNPPQ